MAMLSVAPASKRASLSNVWARFRDQPNKYHFPNFKCFVTPKPHLLSMMLDHYTDDDIVIAHKSKLIDIENELQQGGGVISTVYKQIDYDQDVKNSGVEYAGATMIGRAYCGHPFVRLPRKLLNTMYKQTHVELDIRSSFPTMLLNIFRINSESMREYVNNPESVFEKMADVGLSRSEVKKMILKVIGALPSRPYNLGLGVGNEERARLVTETDWFKGFVDDLERITSAMKEDYTDFWQVVLAKKTVENAAEHAVGAALTHLASDMEHVVMRTVINKLLGNEPEDVVWLFDGILVPRAALRVGWDDVCLDLRRHVREELELDVSFTIKVLDDVSLPICISEAEMRCMTAYEKWKTKHERSWFHLQNPPVYVKVYPDGTLQEHNSAQFSHNTMSEEQDMIKMWKSDAKKRSYLGMDFAPPPLVVKTGHYNTFSGIAGDSMDVHVDDDYDLSMYFNHVHLLVGCNQGYADYLHKLIALKVQKPGFQWRVMPFIRSTQGVGKDVWFDLITKVVGRQNCLRVTKFGDIVDGSMHLLENKLLVCVSEASHADSTKWNDNIKYIITSDTIQCNRKYLPQYFARSCVCIIAFSNDFGAIPISMGDRRIFSLTASGFQANKPEYHLPLIEFFNKPETVKAVYNYYASLDVSGSDPSGDRPITDTYKEMAVQSMNVMEIFVGRFWNRWMEEAQQQQRSSYLTREPIIMVNDNNIRISSKVFWDEFEAFVIERKMFSLDSRAKITKFGARILTELASSLERFNSQTNETTIKRIKSHGKRYYIINVRTLNRYFEQVGDPDDDNDSTEFAAGFEPGN